MFSNIRTSYFNRKAINGNIFMSGITSQQYLENGAGHMSREPAILSFLGSVLKTSLP
jgi:hypothetical protein